MPRWTTLLMAGLIAGLALVPVSARAQMSSKPFSFGSSAGGLGMSIAGRQAVLNQKLFDFTPNVLLKSEDGRLLGVRRGPGRSAIVTSPSGEFLPGYRGRSQSLGFGAGTFNSFFAGGENATVAFLEPTSSAATIDSWTGSVLQGGPVIATSGPVDQWTGMIYFLNRRR